MIDAVYSVTQSAPLIRGNAEQTSTADSFAANPDRVQKAATTSYVSPYYEVDNETQALIYEIRDTSTGKALLKVSSPLAPPQQTTEDVSTYDGSAQIRTASQVLTSSSSTSSSSSSPSISTTPSASAGSTQTTSTASTDQSGESSDQTNSVNAQKIAAFTDASSAGNTNAGTVSFDQIV